MPEQVTIPIAGVAPILLARSLAGDICPACGRSKKRRMTPCAPDYFKLPRAEQTALYRRLGSGYEEAIAAAFRSLGKTRFVMPPPAKGRN